jgi:V8-like Glu-specific endopeptidase
MFDDPIGGGSLSLLFDVPSWTRGVGRIDLKGRHKGTGFYMGNGQVMTNRHVLESIAEEVAGPGGSGWLIEPDAVTIDFSDEGDGSRSHVLTSVLQAGPRPINGIENLENLDMAILSIKASGAELPAPMKFAKDLDENSDIVVIGYPARPGTSALVDPKTGHVSHEIANRLRGIFGTDYGRKYLSPGQFLGAPGTLENDTQDWIVTHDCTTLGGCSGAMVIQLNGSEPMICGLHFSGAPLVANKAHALGVVDAHAFGPILNAPWA